MGYSEFQQVTVAADKRAEDASRGVDLSEKWCREELRISEDRQSEFRQALLNSERSLADVRSELLSFVNEQRVFCGFLDTEQRSYQDLMRQEIAALSRLVDANLNGTAASILRQSPERGTGS